jgi:hypothetical protein
VGVRGYEVQIADVGDAPPGHPLRDALGAAADRLGPGDRGWLRDAKADELAARLTAYHLINRDAAGTPSVPTYRGKDSALDEVIAAGPQTSTSLPSALMNIEYSPPFVVASLVAGVVAGLMNSYRALFTLARLVTVIEGITVTRARSVS